MPYSVVGKLGTGLLWVSMLDMNAAGYTYRLWERPRRGQKEVEHTPVQCAECAVYEDTNWLFQGPQDIFQGRDMEEG